MANDENNILSGSGSEEHLKRIADLIQEIKDRNDELALSEEQRRIKAAEDLLHKQQENILDEQAAKIANESYQKEELSYRINIDSLAIKEKLKDVDYSRLGSASALTSRLKNELDLSKQISSHKKEVSMHEDFIKTLKEEALKHQDDLIGKHLQEKIAIEEKEKIVMDAHQKAMTNISAFGKMSVTVGNVLNSTYFKVLSGIASNLFNFFSSIVSSVFRVLKNAIGSVAGTFLEIQSIVGNINADLGQTEFQTQQVNNNVALIATSAAQFGLKVDEALSFMVRFSEITGRNRVLFAEQVTDLAAISKSTGLGVELTGKMYANMELLNMSTSQFHKYVEETRKTTGMIGINITKVLTTVNELLPAYYALNFKEGLEGLTKLVTKAQGLRFELTNMRNLAVQVFNPEGAVELAAKLRVLGGDFARMADPFNLMLKAQTDAAGLMDDVINSVANMAIKNQKGFFEIPPVQQALLREFAAATGENVDNLIKATLESAKQNDIMSRLRGIGIMNKDDMQAIANLAEFDEKTGQYMIRVDMMGTKKAISEINASMDGNIRERLLGFVREEEQVAATRMNLVEQVKNLWRTFSYSMYTLFRPLEALLKDSRVMTQLQHVMTDLGKTISNILLPMLGSGGAVYEFLLGVGSQLAGFLKNLAEILSGKKSVIDVISTAIVEILKEVWKKVQVLIGGLGQTETGKKVIGGISTGLQVGGGLYGAMMGAQFGSMIAPGIGTAIGAVVGGLTGWGAGYYAKNALLSGPKADDFIMRSDGRVQQFNKDDIIIGGTKILPKPFENRPEDLLTSRTNVTDITRIKETITSTAPMINVSVGSEINDVLSLVNAGLNKINATLANNFIKPIIQTQSADNVIKVDLLKPINESFNEFKKNFVVNIPKPEISVINREFDLSSKLSDFKNYFGTEISKINTSLPSKESAVSYNNFNVDNISGVISESLKNKIDSIKPEFNIKKSVTEEYTEIYNKSDLGKMDSAISTSIKDGLASAKLNVINAGDNLSDIKSITSKLLNSVGSLNSTVEKDVNVNVSPVSVLGSVDSAFEKKQDVTTKSMFDVFKNLKNDNKQEIVLNQNYGDTGNIQYNKLLSSLDNNVASISYNSKRVPSVKENVARMIPSKGLLDQVKVYEKQSFIPLREKVVETASVSTAPQTINLNLSGTLEVRGDDNTAYLTSADLKNIGLQQLTYAVLNEADRYRNHMSGKKLKNEIITPIRNV